MNSFPAVKILYIITKGDGGGAQKYVADLSANINSNNFEATVLSGGNDLRWLSNRIYPWFLFINDWLAIIELVRAFHRERPDVIHLNSSKAGVLGSLAAFIYNHLPSTSYKPSSRAQAEGLQAKVIFTAHGWVFNPTNHYSRGVRWFYIGLHKFAALFQNTIINVSEYDRELALQYKIAPAHKLVTIHNGIDPNIMFLSKEEARKEILRRLSLSDYKLQATSYKLAWVGSIGRLTKEKDYETLIRAASEVPDAYFFIIGDGPEFKKLQATSYKLQAHNHVFFVPPEGNDARLLRAFDVFVLSSIKEGLPYSLLEAMAAELPIVVTAVGGMREVIRDDTNGKVVPPKNTKGIANAITQSLTADATARARKAREDLEKRFGLAAMIRATESTYR